MKLESKRYPTPNEVAQDDSFASTFDETGNRTVSRHYTDGQLTGGQPTSAMYWQNGRNVGDALYRNGELYSARQIIPDVHGEATMEKFFNNGKWSVRSSAVYPARTEESISRADKSGDCLTLSSRPVDCLKELKLDY